MYTEQYLSATYYKVEFPNVKYFHLKFPEHLDTAHKKTTIYRNILYSFQVSIAISMCEPYSKQSRRIMYKSKLTKI